MPVHGSAGTGGFTAAVAGAVAAVRAALLFVAAGASGVAAAVDSARLIVASSASAASMSPVISALSDACAPRSLRDYSARRKERERRESECGARMSDAAGRSWRYTLPILQLPPSPLPPHPHRVAARCARTKRTASLSSPLARIAVITLLHIPGATIPSAAPAMMQRAKIAASVPTAHSRSCRFCLASRTRTSRTGKDALISFRSVRHVGIPHNRCDMKNFTGNPFRNPRGKSGEP
jgi:hypothetical protein